MNVLSNGLSELWQSDEINNRKLKKESFKEIKRMGKIEMEQFVFDLFTYGVSKGYEKGIIAGRLTGAKDFKKITTSVCQKAIGKAYRLWDKFLQEMGEGKIKGYDVTDRDKLTVELLKFFNRNGVSDVEIKDDEEEKQVLEIGVQTHKENGYEIRWTRKNDATLVSVKDIVKYAHLSGGARRILCKNNEQFIVKVQHNKRELSMVDIFKLRPLANFANGLMPPKDKAKAKEREEFVKWFDSIEPLKFKVEAKETDSAAEKIMRIIESKTEEDKKAVAIELNGITEEKGEVQMTEEKGEVQMTEEKNTKKESRKEQLKKLQEQIEVLMKEENAEELEIRIKELEAENKVLREGKAEMQDKVKEMEDTLAGYVEALKKSKQSFLEKANDISYILGEEAPF